MLKKEPNKRIIKISIEIQIVNNDYKSRIFFFLSARQQIVMIYKN